MRHLSPPFVIRISKDGEPDFYLLDEANVDLDQFDTMTEALALVEKIRHGLDPGEFPAVVPLAAVPLEDR